MGQGQILIIIPLSKVWEGSGRGGQYSPYHSFCLQLSFKRQEGGAQTAPDGDPSSKDSPGQDVPLCWRSSCGRRMDFIRAGVDSQSFDLLIVERICRSSI